MEVQSLMGLEVLPWAAMALGMALRGEGLILVVEQLLLLKEVNIITCDVEKIKTQAPLKGKAEISSCQKTFHTTRQERDTKTFRRFYIFGHLKGPLIP